MQRRCRGTYLSTNRMVQTETGKQHGDNCRRCEHVPVNQPSPVKKTSCVSCEKLQEVWGLRSLGECMKDHSWQWRSCGVHSSGANQTCRFQEKKHLTTIFSLSWTRCARPRYMMFVATGKKTISAVKPPYVSVEVHKQEVEIPEFLAGNVSRFLSVGLLTGW